MTDLRRVIYKPVLKLDFTASGIMETLTEFRPSSRDINNIRQQLQERLLQQRFQKK
jgi:hypothetical protein